MSATIHPHKGYLNTLFHFHVTGAKPVDYRIATMIDNEENEILNGIISPNEPFTLKLPLPGCYNVKFSDGTAIPLIVEDGYKFGGSKLKRAFVFDDCPWLFVVMHDRTYFYNRVSKESYVESISPDEITVINTNHVIFKNNNHPECSVYSLTEQKPILYISDILYYNDYVIVWKESEENLIAKYSFNTHETIHQAFNYLDIDKVNERILYSHNNTISSIALCIDGKVLPNTNYSNIVGIIAPCLAISHEKKSGENSLYIHNIDTKKIIKKIPINGDLAKIGNNEFIDIKQRYTSIEKFDISNTEFPEAIISTDYFNFDFFPCEWDVFYTIKHTRIIKSLNGLYSEVHHSLHACNAELDYKINSSFTNSIILGDSIILYNNRESFVRNKTYSGSGYHEGGDIHIKNNSAYLYENRKIYKLLRNGYWDRVQEGDYDFSNFDEFGVIKNKTTTAWETLDRLVLGKHQMINYGIKPYILTDKYYVFSDKHKLERSNDKIPAFLSINLSYGINVTNNGVLLCSYKNGTYTENQILSDIFDTSKYKDVLLSEDGQFIMHRDDKKTIVTNIVDSSSALFDNLSYVKHINGIRPLFSVPSSLQPRLINPVTKQAVDYNMMTQFQFISPNGKLYAETTLDEYTEYYWRNTNQLLSKAEYQAFCKKYTYPWLENEKSNNRIAITQLRKKLVLDNFEFLNRNFREIFKDDKTGQNWNEFVLDVKNVFDTSRFIDLFIAKRGIVVIRKTSDGNIYAKINIGDPLWYLNYVSFSYDNNYVAIGGRYPNGSGKGGLFLVYDLIRKKVVTEKTNSWAIWLTSFNKKGQIAGYSSEPITYEATITDVKDVQLLEHHGYNFLTFSPDGNLTALSKQGYISKTRKDKTVRLSWGHQPSCEVYIAFSHSMDNIVERFSDLSQEGIDGSSDRKHNFPKSVASVSFSCDNKRLMMVGNDGVVIIRNLHIE